MSAKILVVGSINMDLMMKVDTVPGPGETALGERYEWIPGGKGANQAVAAARLGAQTSFCGRVGHDAQGRTLIESLKRDNVDTRHLTSCAHEPTGLAAIPVDATGQNRIMVFPGANARLTMDDVHKALREPFDAVMLQLEIPLDVVYGTIALAKKKGIRAVLDAGPATKIDLSALQGLDIISPNESETETLVGIRPTNWQLAREASIRLLSETSAQHVVLKMGARGSYWMGKGIESGFGFATQPVKAIDTTAAGDCFTAAMTLRLLETNDFVSSIKYANICAALSTTRIGAQTSLPTAQEVARFLSEWQASKE